MELYQFSIALQKGILHASLNFFASPIIDNKTRPHDTCNPFKIFFFELENVSLRVENCYHPQ